MTENTGTGAPVGQDGDAPGQEQPRSIDNGTRLLAADGVVYRVTNLNRTQFTIGGLAVKRADGTSLDRQTLTLVRDTPKIRGKAAKKRAKRARQARLSAERGAYVSMHA